MGAPSVYPMGTTVYDPEKCWNGYTLFQAWEHGAMLIDMNGKVVNFWKGLQGFPNRLLPDGSVLGSLAERDSDYGWQDQVDLVQVDWDGNVVWKFDHNELIEDPGHEPLWMAKQHHDYQIEGNPVGYFVPGMDPDMGGKKLLLTHHNVHNSEISDKPLIDDRIIEIDGEGNIIWEWNCNEHFREMGFSEEAKNTICAHPAMRTGGGDWMHVNCASWLGPNKWYDAGDERFHPDNIIIDGRNTNVLAIISKETGKLVWKLGPDYQSTREGRRIGQIIGQHHTHMIPRGLPGEGNILVFDNGGWAGYGAPNPTSPTGEDNAHRAYSRVIEIDPVEMKIVWECTPATLGYAMPFVEDHFYSPYISSAQRLPNGNTMITQGSDGRLFEVTPACEIVWEYHAPYFGKISIPTNMVYRSYRYPYAWAPQAPAPEEVAIAPVDNSTYRLPGAAGPEPTRTVEVEGTAGYQRNEGFCVKAE